MYIGADFIDGRRLFDFDDFIDSSRLFDFEDFFDDSVFDDFSCDGNVVVVVVGNSGAAPLYMQATAIFSLSTRLHLVSCFL